MTVTVQALTDPDEFAAQAEAALAQDPVRYSIIATALRRARAGGSPGPSRWWIARDDDGRTVGLALYTRSGRPYLVAGSEHGQAFGAAVAADLATDRAVGPLADGVTGVNGFIAAARGFAQEWVRRRPGHVVRAGREDLLYELPGPVRMPHGVPGRARVATEADRAWLDDWGRAFIREIGDPPDPTVTMEQPLTEGRVIVWELPRDSELPADATTDRAEDARAQSVPTTGSLPVLTPLSDRGAAAIAALPAEPVAMTYATAPLYGHTRLSWVWTSPEHRRRGFGAAVTAAVSHDAESDGVRCLLVADAADAASNALYRRLGYQSVDEACHLHFVRAPA